MPLTERQHEIRNRGIGSSDAAAAVGMSPWKSPVQLWLEKTGRVQPEDISDRDAVHFGNVLEDIVAQEFCRRRGHKVQRRTEPYVRGHMVANVDRLIIGENAILECKTASAFTAGKWDDVPTHYRIQVEHQLICADKHHAVLAVLIGGNSYADFEITRNDELSALLIEKEAEFWDHVLTDTPPEPTTAADVVALYPHDDGQVVIADAELAEFHAELVAVRSEVKGLEERKAQLEDRIKLAMGGHASILLHADGPVLCTWKAARSSERTDYKAAAVELAQALGDRGDSILKAHTREVPGSRRFLLKEATK